jgi:hypothetical protein
MQWRHRLVDRLGGELFADLDPPRAIGYWERYAAELRSVSQPSQWEQSEITTARAQVEKLRGQVK